MSGVVDPADDEEAADLLDNTDAGSGTDYRTKIDDGEAFLVKVSFYVVYSPRADYGGTQYPDGTNSIYVFTPVDDLRPCEAISGWYSTDSTAAIPELSDEARELNLNEWQHDAGAPVPRLAAAGITDFAAPCRLDRGADGPITSLPAAGTTQPQPAGLYGGTGQPIADHRLYCCRDDWSSNARFFCHRFFPGTTATADDLPGNARLHLGVCQQQRHHHRHRQRGRHPANCRYTFSIYNGSDLKWDARTVCTGKEPVSQHKKYLTSPQKSYIIFQQSFRYAAPYHRMVGAGSRNSEIVMSTYIKYGSVIIIEKEVKIPCRASIRTMWTAPSLAPAAT